MPDLDVHDCPVAYVPREAWGLTDAEARRRGMVVQPLARREVYLHHQGAGSVTNDPIRWAQGLDNYARNTKGYRAVDYNHGVTVLGGAGGVAVVELRGRYIGGATEDRNTLSKSICLAGNRAAVGVTPAEVDAVRWLLFAERRAGWLADGYLLAGHRDNPSHPGATSCPGALAYAALPHMVRPWTAQPPPPPIAPEDDMPVFVRDAANHHRILERLPGGAYVDVDDQDVFDVLGVVADSLPVRNIAPWIVVSRESIHLPIAR